MNLFSKTLLTYACGFNNNILNPLFKFNLLACYQNSMFRSYSNIDAKCWIFFHKFVLWCHLNSKIHRKPLHWPPSLFVDFVKDSKISNKHGIASSAINNPIRSGNNCSSLSIRVVRINFVKFVTCSFRAFAKLKTRRRCDHNHHIAKGNS